MIGVGQRHNMTFRVDEAKTADSYGNAGFFVLATPYLAAVFEKCTVEFMTPHLDPQSATVGTRLEIDHLAATALGKDVTIECELIAIEKAKLAFRLEAKDSSGVVARCVHRRVIVDRAKFLQRISAASS